MFLIEMMQDMWHDDWLGKAMFFLMAVIIIMLVFLLLGFLHWAVDSWFQDEQEGTGVVLSKYFTAAHTTTTFVMTGKVMVPITNFHPDTWTVVFGIGDKQGSIDITRQFYDNVNQNDRYRIKYREGRISDELYVDDIL